MLLQHARHIQIRAHRGRRPGSDRRLSRLRCRAGELGWSHCHACLPAGVAAMRGNFRIATATGAKRGASPHVAPDVRCRLGNDRSSSPRPCSPHPSPSSISKPPGPSAGADRITEVGIVRVDDGSGVSEWSSLVDPQRSIPNGVQAMTGITNAMVAARADVRADRQRDRRAAGRMRVRRAQRPLRLRLPEAGVRSARQSLSRQGGLHGQAVASPVSRSRPAQPGRGDRTPSSARQRSPPCPRRCPGAACVHPDDLSRADAPKSSMPRSRACSRRRAFRRSFRPDALDGIPEAPGVYLFYGLNALPLYIGKSIDLRARVASHFSSDYRNANDLRLSAEITRIEFEETAGEIGALLRESQLIKALFPVYNQRLRRRNEMLAPVRQQRTVPARLSSLRCGRSGRARRSVRSILDPPGGARPRCGISRPMRICAGPRSGSTAAAVPASRGS